MKLYIHIVDNDYFKELGFSQQFLTDGRLNKAAIENELDSIVKDARSAYPNFNFAKNMIKYDSLVNFAISYFKEFDFLNFSK